MHSKPQTVTEVDAWLKARFGVLSLRSGQAEVVHRLLNGERVLFVAPTGYGKSLCYQAIAASPWSKGVVLVFTPLKALMAEQVDRALKHSLRAALINSDQEPDEQATILERAARSELDILFIAPERLGNELWKERLGDMPVKAVVIDEAHCVSQWGHDFRPWYRRLVKIVTGLGLRTPVLAVTATAPGQVVEDVAMQIAPRGQAVAPLRLPSVRTNISHAVWTAATEEERLALVAHAAATRKGQPGIAYFVTTREAEQAARWLRYLGLSAIAYHSKLDAEEKQARLIEWQAERADVACSTSALGMGVDRADVRWVLHCGLPSSLIQYVQEFGRAGRDGDPAQAIAIDDASIKSLHLAMLRSSAPEWQDYEGVFDAVTRGFDGRTAIVEELDLPENHVQRVLEDLLESGTLRKEDVSPARYTIGRAPMPAENRETRQVRVRLLEEAYAWGASLECRRVSLAAAMGDEEVPTKCGTCDRCSEQETPDASAYSASLRTFLLSDFPEIRPSTPQGLSAGVALSWYGMGFLGTAVANAKRTGRATPKSLLHSAIAALRSAPFADFQPQVIAYIPPTHSRDFVCDFAQALAERLQIPAVPLIKTRETQPQKNFRSRHNKQKNVKGVFAYDRAKIAEDHVLLVDDIYDSGATLREAAKFLKRPNRVVRPLVMARTRHSDDQ